MDTQLETILERALSKESIEFKERIYREEFHLAAQIDEALNPTSESLTNEMIEDLSEYQRRVFAFDEGIPSLVFSFQFKYLSLCLYGSTFAIVDGAFFLF